MNLKSTRIIKYLGSLQRQRLLFKKRMINESKLEENTQVIRATRGVKPPGPGTSNASLFSALFNDTADILAQTVTDVYQALITYMVKRQLSRMGLREYTKVSYFRSLSSECQDCCIKVIGRRL